MLMNLNLRSLGLSTAIVLAMSAFAARAATMPTTLDPAPADASAAEVETRLYRMGFTQVQDVAHSGDVYTTKAKWDGEWVDLRIDAKTGGIVDLYASGEAIGLPAGFTEQQVRDELQVLGYSGVSDYEHRGNVITAKAYRDGAWHDLHIDTESGGIRHENVGDTAIRSPKPNLSAAELREQLLPLGYSDVRNVEEQGDVYTLNAFRNGAWSRLRVNAENGAVTVIE